MPSGSGRNPELTAAEREWLGEVRAAEGASGLAEITGAGSEHGAYFEAKHEWNRLRRKELSVPGLLEQFLALRDPARFRVPAAAFRRTAAVRRGVVLRNSVPPHGLSARHSNSTSWPVSAPSSRTWPGPFPPNALRRRVSSEISRDAGGRRRTQ